MSVRGRHCDYSAQAPTSLTMPLHTHISKSLSIHAYIPLRNLLNKSAASKKSSYEYHVSMGHPNLHFDFLQLIITWKA